MKMNMRMFSASMVGLPGSVFSCCTSTAKEKDNKSPEQLELEKLRKENQQLKMGNDILKQAALTMGRK